MLNKKDVEHLAKLANLILSDEEVTIFGKQLQETITYVENLNELDTSHVDATSHSGVQKNITFTDGTVNERGLTQEQALKNAKKQNDGYFEVDRIM